MKSTRHRYVIMGLCALPVVMVTAIQAGCYGDESAPAEQVSRTEAPAVGEMAATCHPRMGFSFPKAVSFHDQLGVELIANMTSARLSGSGGMLYFSTVTNGPSPAGGWDLWAGNIMDPAVIYDIHSVRNVNSPTTDRWPSLTDDDLNLVFASSRLDPNGGRIFMSRRTGIAQNFEAPREITGLPSGALDAPFLRANNELWFQTQSGGGDIWRTTITNGVAGPATPVTELNHPTAYDTAPVLTNDGLMIFFARTVKHIDAGRNTVDIWTASRASINEPFSDVRDVPELNSTQDEWPTSISADGCRLYFASERDGQRRRIYTATRPPTEHVTPPGLSE